MKHCVTRGLCGEDSNRIAFNDQMKDDAKIELVNIYKIWCKS